MSFLTQPFCPILISSLLEDSAAVMLIYFRFFPRLFLAGITLRWGISGSGAGGTMSSGSSLVSRFQQDGGDNRHRCLIVS